MALSMNIMRLFDYESSSPQLKSTPSRWDDSAEIEAVITSVCKGDKSTVRNFFLEDEDSGLGMEADVTEDDIQFSIASSFSGQSDLNGSFAEVKLHQRSAFIRFRCSGVKKCLFSLKRPAENQDTDFETEDTCQSLKRVRNTESSLLKFALQNSPVSAETEVHSIIQAVDRLTTEEDLVADGSRDYSLPTISGKHQDLKTISPETMANTLRGDYADSVGEVTVIDCRYPYEYRGGHIKGAVNLYTKDAVHQLLELPTSKPRVLIFHCEFSSERGPKMFRFLRSQDRELNKDSYPKLNFPEIYLLEGGYKAFYYKYQTLCDPVSYKSMLHENHAEDLRHFRVKSKSWAAGQKRQKQRNHLSRSCLSFNY